MKLWLQPLIVICVPETQKIVLLYLGQQSLWLRFFIIQAFITCSRKGDWKMSHKADSNGLVQGHAYTITGLYRVHAQDLGRICLLRIRNPWGDKNEWKGEQNFSWKEQLKFSPIFLFSLVFNIFFKLLTSRLEVCILLKHSKWHFLSHSHEYKILRMFLFNFF